MNLELPFFAEASQSPLDEYLATIDRELDALFLGEVDGELERLRAERQDPADSAFVA